MNKIEIEMPPKNSDITVKIESAVCKRVEEMCSKLEALITPAGVKEEFESVYRDLRTARDLLQQSTSLVEDIGRKLNVLLNKDEYW